MANVSKVERPTEAESVMRKFARLNLANQEIVLNAVRKLVKEQEAQKE